MASLLVKSFAGATNNTLGLRVHRCLIPSHCGMDADLVLPPCWPPDMMQCSFPAAIQSVHYIIVFFLEALGAVTKLRCRSLQNSGLGGLHVHQATLAWLSLPLCWPPDIMGCSFPASIHHVVYHFVFPDASMLLQWSAAAGG
jgi:hypothetical protein